ncbi:MAG: histidinol dehydrogenase [Peptococcaceae bacterium]|nr:histidinol dehydrogenase [Peptococcaceae bacterium]
MLKQVVAFRDVDRAHLLHKSYGDEAALETAVRGIIQDVRARGDEAVREYTRRFDGVDFAQGCRVSPEEMEEASKKADPAICREVARAKDNIEAFHVKQKRVSWMEPKGDGCVLGQLMIPLQRVGIYVPGGTAPYLGSVLMNAVPARVAGVEEIVMATPPQADGSVLPEMLVAALLCGVKEIYKMGGAQAIAAMAYGTSTIGKVDKITGPGNIYVTLAKKLVYGSVDIDMLAGPSEILILADADGKPEELAADLLSQAEHDVLASAILISPDRGLLEATVSEVEKQVELLPRSEIARASWEKYGAAILVEDLEQGMELVNAVAPEHFELVVRDPYAWLGKVRNAGAVFIGRSTPEPVGDYFAGPNHILPTGGAARFFSVLDVDAFMKKTSVIQYSQEALQRDAGSIMALARKEGFEAHARAVEKRLGK